MASRVLVCFGLCRRDRSLKRPKPGLLFSSRFGIAQQVPYLALSKKLQYCKTRESSSCPRCKTKSIRVYVESTRSMGKEASPTIAARGREGLSQRHLMFLLR